MSHHYLSKKGKWIASIAGIIFLLIFILLLLLGGIVKNILTKQVKDQTNGAYHLAIEDVNINLFAGNAFANKIKITPDTAAIQRSTQFNDIYEISAESVQIEGLDLWKLLMKQDVLVDRISFVKPIVQLNKMPVSKEESKDAGGADEKQTNLPKVSIHQIDLDNARLTVTRGDTVRKEFLAVDEISFRIDEFLYSSVDSDTGLKDLQFDNFTFVVKDYSLDLPDSLYTVSFDSLKASVKQSSLMVHGVTLEPRLGKYEFGRYKGEQIDRIQLNNKLLHLTNFDFRALLREEKIKIGAVKVDSVNMHVFRDKENPMPDRYKKLPQQQLRELNVYLHIDSISLENMNITYEEKVEGASESGHINFINLRAEFFDITNDSVLLAEGAAINGNAQAYLMGKGRINAYFNLPIADGSNTHDIKGSMTPMNLEELNPMIQQVAFVEIESGKANDLSFEARATESSSTGSMKFGYENLKINLVDKESTEDKKGLVSLLANTFVVKKANPLNSNDLRVGEMSFERDKRKSILNFWWKTLLSGFKDTLGVPESVGN